MKLSWQATLFGESAFKAYIYASNPCSAFEKLLNKFFEVNGSSGKTKKELTDRVINYGTITAKVVVFNLSLHGSNC